MHALLAHMYHLALYAIHVATRPVWRPLGACLGAALAGRLAGLARNSAGAALVAGMAVLAGWLVEAAPLDWPLPPIARLTGMAVLLAADGVVRARVRRGWPLPVTAALGAFSLRGAPMDGSSILGCVPVFVGLLAALAASRRLARSDTGWATLAAAGALAGGLLVTGASPHWARAAGVPAMAALALMGVPDAMPTVAGLVAVVGLATLVASDRGRLVPVDFACLVPVLVWLVVPRLARRTGRWGLAIVGLATAAGGVALAWAVHRAMAPA